MSQQLKDYGLECLAVPSFIAVGVYGEKAYPNDNTIESGFGGSIPPDVIAQDREAGTIGQSFGRTASVNVGAGLDLSFLGKWAPNVAASFSDASLVRVSVNLGAAKIRVIQNLESNMRRILSDDSAPNKTAVEGMRRKLCSPGYVICTLALIARPTITIETVEKTAFKSSVGWKVAGFNVDTTKASDGKLTLTAKTDVVFAVQTRRSAKVLERLCSPCGSADERCCDYGNPCGDGLACAGEHCKQCGKIGQICCTGATKCVTLNAFCSDGGNCETPQTCKYRGLSYHNCSTADCGNKDSTIRNSDKASTGCRFVVSTAKAVGSGQGRQSFGIESANEEVITSVSTTIYQRFGSSGINDYWIEADMVCMRSCP